MMLPTPKLGNALPLGNVKIAVIGLGTSQTYYSYYLQ